MKTSYSQTSSPNLFSAQTYAQRWHRCDPENFLARQCADRLVDRISFIKRDFAKIGLIGQGQKNLIAGLQDLGHGSQAVQSHDVVEFLKSEQIPLTSQNLILCNLSLHSVNDLPGVLWQIRHSLQPDGLFIGTLLGGQTLQELKACFLQAEMELYAGASPRVVPMVDLYTASQLLLRADLRLPVADREVFKVDYETLDDLMRDLRLLGLTNTMQARQNVFSSRRLFAKVEDIYRKNFSVDGYFQATFEVIYMTGWSPHDSQQKALRPGSAQLSLAEALED